MAFGTRPERDGWDRHLLADRGRPVLTASQIATVAKVADTHPTTILALYAGAAVSPAARRRILDAVRLLGRGRWPMPGVRLADAADGRLRGARRVVVEVEVDR